MKSTVTSGDVSHCVTALGIVPGDVVVVHSSMKSLGYVEGGPEAVIRGFEDVLGRDGTLVLPTFVQKDFAHAYETWYMDKPSDVGLLTEYFRKQMYVYRSNQATHSVAARGKLAYELTHEHGAYGPHICPCGDTAFADSSPWMKMYRMNAKIVLLGCTGESCTMKHTVESRYAEHLLSCIPEEGKRAEMLSRLQKKPSESGVWFYFPCEDMVPLFVEKGIATETTCGDATVSCLQSKPCMDMAYDLLSGDPKAWLPAGSGLDWVLECLEAAK